MKFNKIAMAVLAASAVPLAAQAGVTVTPQVGYHYANQAHKEQRKIFNTGKDLKPQQSDSTPNGGTDFCSQSAKFGVI